MSKRGGKRAGAGRPKGAVNKVQRTIREAAQEYSEEALEILASIARQSDSDSARVSAARELLDRGHGKSTQHVEGSIKRDLTSLSDEELTILAGEIGTSKD